MGDRLVRQAVLQLVDEGHETVGRLAVQPGQPAGRHRGAQQVGQDFRHPGDGHVVAHEQVDRHRPHVRAPAGRGNRLGREGGGGLAPAGAAPLLGSVVGDLGPAVGEVEDLAGLDAGDLGDAQVRLPQPRHADGAWPMMRSGSATRSRWAPGAPGCLPLLRLPFSRLAGTDTFGGVLELSPGVKVWTSLSLTPGRYVATSFSLDPKTQVPEAVEGAMLTEFTVT